MTAGAWPRAPLLAALALSACGTARIVRQPLPDSLAWPPEEPRVRLESVLEGWRGPQGLIRALGGGRQAPLFARPQGLAWMGNDLLTADAGTRRIVRIGAGGRITLSAEDAAGTPVALAVCPQGVVAADSDGGRVALLSPELRRLRWLAEGLDRPTGVACDAEAVFVVETGRHRVVRLAAGGPRVTFGQRGRGPGEFNFPTSVAVHGSSLWIGDTLNFRVQRLDAATGAFQGILGRLGDGPGDTPRVKAVAVDAAENVWVSDGYLDQVSVFEPSGGLLISLGGRGERPGEFSLPAGLAAHPDGRVAVADALNRRVQVFRLVRAGPR